jgi:hypothetical protein
MSIVPAVTEMMAYVPSFAPVVALLTTMLPELLYPSVSQLPPSKRVIWSLPPPPSMKLNPVPASG